MTKKILFLGFALMISWPLSMGGAVYFLRRCQAFETERDVLFLLSYVFFLSAIPLSVIHALVLACLLSYWAYWKSRHEPINRLCLAGLIYYFGILLGLLLSYGFDIHNIIRDVASLYGLYWFAFNTI